MILKLWCYSSFSDYVFYVRLTCADGGSDKMADGLSGDGDGDITDELIPAGKNY